jgi:elongation factor G
MSSSSAEGVRNVVIVGHKGAGKTALVAAMRSVARGGRDPAPNGKRDERPNDLDTTPEEREHGATLESRVARIEWAGKVIHAIDSPGEPSFFCDARFAIAAADAAILVVSGKDGVQPSTERLFAAVRESKLPCLVVLTRADEESARDMHVVAELKTRLRAPVTVMEVIVARDGELRGVVDVETQTAWVDKPEGAAHPPAGEIPPELKHDVEETRAHLVEEVAATDDALTDRYLTSGDLPQGALDDGLRHAIASGRIVPVFTASSSPPRGVGPLLDAIVDLLPPPDAHAAWTSTAGETRAPSIDAPPALFVWKTRIDTHAGRLSYARVLSGVVRSDAPFVNAATGVPEPPLHIQRFNGAKDLVPADEARAGEIIALGKLKGTRTGDTLSDPKGLFALTPPELAQPLYARALVVEGKGALDKVVSMLQRLSEEDPGLAFRHEEATHELVLSGHGALHLEITVERLRRRTGIECRLGPPKTAYKETITRKVTRVEGKQKKQTGGHGQFAVCYIDVEPLARGAGFLFEDAVVGGSVPRQFITSVEKGVIRAMQRGVLAGFPMVDVKVRLVDGKAHSVDSSDAAFQVAAYKALIAAAKSAHPALLEPVAKLQVTVPEEAMGDVLGDLNSRHAKVLSADASGQTRVISAFVPLASTNDYEPSLKRMTHGSGAFTLVVDHYDFTPVHVQERVAKESGFKPVAEED